MAEDELVTRKIYCTNPDEAKYMPTPKEQLVILERELRDESPKLDRKLLQKPIKSAIFQKNDTLKKQT